MAMERPDNASVAARIEALKAEMLRAPAHRQNIQAIIQYYEQGGLPPVGTHVVVYTCGNGVKRGSMEDAANDIKANANGRQPFIDFDAQQLSHLSNPSS